MPLLSTQPSARVEHRRAKGFTERPTRDEALRLRVQDVGGSPSLAGMSAEQVARKAAAVPFEQRHRGVDDADPPEHEMDASKGRAYRLSTDAARRSPFPRSASPCSPPIRYGKARRRAVRAHEPIGSHLITALRIGAQRPKYCICNPPPRPCGRTLTSRIPTVSGLCMRLGCSRRSSVRRWTGGRDWRRG